MSDADSSEDETGLRMSRLVHHDPSRCKLTPGMTPSAAEGSIEQADGIPTETVELWSQLPEIVRLDPCFAAIRREFDNTHRNTQERARMLDDDEEMQNSFPRNQEHNQKNNLDHTHVHEKKRRSYLRYIKFTLLTGCWIMFTFILLFYGEKKETMKQISVPVDNIRTYLLPRHPTKRQVEIILEGALLSPIHTNLSTHHLTVWLQLFINEENITGLPHSDMKSVKNISKSWIIPLLSENLTDIDLDKRQHNIFELENLDSGSQSGSVIGINFRTNVQTIFPVGIAYDLSPIDLQDGVIYAAVVLLGLYVLIVFEVVHKALAAMLASTMALAILAGLNQRPTTEEVISWIDIETLLLLFSMMILVDIFADTGFLDYMAVYAYKITKGRLWPLLTTLCFFTGIMSSFVDNVTTILLVTPVTIKLWEMMELNPIPVLIAMSIYSNLGGAATPVGDPPNIIIVSNRYIIDAGIDFVTFTLHMGIGSIVVMLVVYVHLRFIFRDPSIHRSKKHKGVEELRDELELWRKSAAALSQSKKNECLVENIMKTRIQRLATKIEKKSMTGSGAIVNYRANLKELQKKYPIRDKVLLAKSGFILALVILLFFLHSIPNLNLSLGWTALLGCLLLLVWADEKDLNSLLSRVEWGTLLFFAALFIFMEAVSRLGLIKWIGLQTEAVILSVNEESRLAVAILLILWVSAIAGAFVDNIPLTTMMVRVATELASKQELGLPLQPLIWALAFGACFGGNGTIIGASANLVCAGVAEQHGYRISFMQFFKIGFPVMLTSTVTITVYLLICHVLFDWNG